MLKLLLVDDHPVARAGLAAVLRTMEGGADVVEAATADEGLQTARARADLDAAFIDLMLPDGDGISLLSALRQQSPQLPVVVMSASESPVDARRALAAGALGYLPKSAPAQTILSAFRLILEGNVYVPPLLLQEREAAATLLTQRQLQILKMLCEGLSNKDICRKLGLSEKTVKAHLTGVFKVLNVEGRVQAAMAARARGFIDAP